MFTCFVEYNTESVLSFVHSASAGQYLINVIINFGVFQNSSRLFRFFFVFFFCF
jgi:hypothetical protein